MPTNRPNPTDGLLDLFHTDSNTWVRAVALLQIAGGLNVKLTADQEALLEAIGIDTQKIQNLLSEIQGVRTSLNTLNTTEANVRTTLDTNISPSLSAILTNLAEIEAIEANILSKVDTTRLLIADITNAALADIASRTVNYSTPFSTANTALGSIDSRLTTANTALASIDSRLTTANTNLANINTAINNLKPTGIILASVTLNASDTQFSYSIPANTKKLSFKVRRDATGNSYDVRYAFAVGQVANPASGTYRTLDAYNEFSEEFNNLTGATLYLASTSASGGNLIPIEIEVLS